VPVHVCDWVANPAIFFFPARITIWDEMCGRGFGSLASAARPGPTRRESGKATTARARPVPGGDDEGVGQVGPGSRHVRLLLAGQGMGMGHGIQ